MGKNLIKLDPDEKVCQTCYLPFSYRKKWEKNWSEVKYCSDKCRRHKNQSLKEAIEPEILKLAKQRGTASFCPSEVARALFEDWRPKMETVRQVARKMMLEGRISILQKNKPVKSLNFKGPIRLKLPS
ncbi:MAG: DUF2256 and DUF3253 domain-containing protein [Bdellovibrionales bacterium]|nr:DUF2256 and DUF3253 domain-containing protein [Bdellovibrionales bacterium]